MKFYTVKLQLLNTSLSELLQEHYRHTFTNTTAENISENDFLYH